MVLTILLGAVFLTIFLCTLFSSPAPSLSFSPIPLLSSCPLSFPFLSSPSPRPRRLPISRVTPLSVTMLPRRVYAASSLAAFVLRGFARQAQGRIMRTCATRYALRESVRRRHFSFSLSLSLSLDSRCERTPNSIRSVSRTDAPFFHLSLSKSPIASRKIRLQWTLEDRYSCTEIASFDFRTHILF